METLFVTGLATVGGMLLVPAAIEIVRAYWDLMLVWLAYALGTVIILELTGNHVVDLLYHFGLRLFGQGG